MTLAERARWLLLDPEGRRTLAIVYLIAGAVSVAAYTLRYSIWYGISQAFLVGFGLWWVRWCIRR